MMRTDHEITLHEFQLMRQTLLLRISRRALDLVVVVIQSGDVRSGELGDFSGGSTNTAANVEDFVAVFNADFGGEVMFVAGDSLVEGLAVCESAEVEGLTPAVLVQIGSKVVVTVIAD
jgi:hypothetical protein